MLLLPCVSFFLAVVCQLTKNRWGWVGPSPLRGPGWGGGWVPLRHECRHACMHAETCRRQLHACMHAAAKFGLCAPQAGENNTIRRAIVDLWAKSVLRRSDLFKPIINVEIATFRRDVCPSRHTCCNLQPNLLQVGGVTGVGPSLGCSGPLLMGWVGPSHSAKRGPNQWGEVPPSTKNGTQSVALAGPWDLASWDPVGPRR